LLCSAATGADRSLALADGAIAAEIQSQASRYLADPARAPRAAAAPGVRCRSTMRASSSAAVIAVNDVSFAVQARENRGLIDRTARKSTTFNLITGC